MNSYALVSGLILGMSLVSVGCGGDDAKPSKQPVGGSGGTRASDDGGEGGQQDDDAKGGEGASSPLGGSASGSGGTVAGSGGSAGSAGSGSVVTFESKPAGIELEIDAASKAAGITLISSSLIQDTGTSLGYTEWRAALHNGTEEIQCFIEVTADFQDASGTSIIQFHSYAYGAAYDSGSGSGLTTTCAAPGETVPIWSNDNPEKVLPIASTKKLVLEVTPMARAEAVLHPSTPSLGAITKEYTNLEWWVVSGQATSKADIYNVKAGFWGKVGEFFVDDAAAFHPEDFLNGQTWDFESIAGINSVELDEVVTYFSFIGGRSNAQLSRHLTPRDAELAAMGSRAHAAWQADEQRRQQYRAKR